MKKVKEKKKKQKTCLCLKTLKSERFNEACVCAACQGLPSCPFCFWRSACTSVHPFCLTPGERCPEGSRYRSNHRWKFNSGLFIQEGGNSTGDGVKKRQMDILRGEHFCLKKTDRSSENGADTRCQLKADLISAEEIHLHGAIVQAVS